jgi:hypothetical protein
VILQGDDGVGKVSSNAAQKRRASERQVFRDDRRRMEPGGEARDATRMNYGKKGRESATKIMVRVTFEQAVQHGQQSALRRV